MVITMVKNNIYAEIRRYMKNAIIRGCTDEEVLKHRAYIYATNLVGENATKEFLCNIRSFINATVILIREECRRGGEGFEKVTLDEVRRRLMNGRNW